MKRKVPRTRRSLVLAAIGLSAVTTGCAAEIDIPGLPGDVVVQGDPNDPNDPDGPGEPAACVGVTGLPSSPLRRLTVDEIQASIAGLLGDAVSVDINLDEDNGAAFTLLGIDKLHVAAEVTAAALQEDSDAFLACAGDVEDAACVDALLNDFGQRAFRRPLDEDERAWLGDVYADLRATQTFEDSLFGLVQVMLQSPQFLYHFEPGVADATAPAGAVRLTGFERASRLSFFLWGSAPDATLLGAAADGVLDQPDGVRAQAERMLNDPRARVRVQQFFADLFELDGSDLHRSLEENPKSDARFPDFDDATKASLRQELVRLGERLVLDEPGTFSDLMLRGDAFVDDNNAAIYGVEAPAEPGWIELPGEQRAGLLTRGAFLALYAGADVQSPIRRGVFILERMMCIPLGDPPPNASDVPVTGGAAGDGGVVSVRQDVDNKTVALGNECASCHNNINPIGFTLENYDAIGRFQTEEVHTDQDGDVVRIPTDASGALLGAPVTGGVALSQAIAENDEARACFSRHWWEAAHGKEPNTREELCAAARTAAQFGAATSVRDLILAIATSDSFLFVNAPEAP